MTSFPIYHSRKYLIRAHYVAYKLKTNLKPKKTNPKTEICTTTLYYQPPREAIKHNNNYAHSERVETHAAYTQALAARFTRAMFNHFLLWELKYKYTTVTAKKKKIKLNKR